eukprot:2231412-Amphidinium_carterae.2
MDDSYGVKGFWCTRHKAAIPIGILLCHHRPSFGDVRNPTAIIFTVRYSTWEVVPSGCSGTEKACDGCGSVWNVIKCQSSGNIVIDIVAVSAMTIVLSIIKLFRDPASSAEFFIMTLWGNLSR